MALSVKERMQGFPFEALIGALIGSTAIAHIPTQLSAGAFDRNAAPQFILLSITAVIASIFLFLKKRIALSAPVGIALAILFSSTLISLIFSESIVTGLIGDTGRFAGMVSLWSLLIIALAFTQFNKEAFAKAAFGASAGIVAVTTLGFLQSFDWITLPTGAGAGSTLGNLDFLSAWIGTTIALVYLFFKGLGYRLWVFIAYLAISGLTLCKIGAKQGPFDFILIATLILTFKGAQLLGMGKLSARALKTIATFALLLWSEAIYLIPMAQIKIPGISGDVNVQIRSDFWYSAGQMFFQHLGFGVGPDNYGSYYEKYRSLNSVRTTEFVVANDAHSSMMQTFATLGIFATLAFLALTLMVIYSLINLAKREVSKTYTLLLISFIAFYTNSLISPMTLPNKVIFWAIAGFAIGQDLRTREFSASRPVLLPTRVIALAATLAISIPTALFGQSFFALNAAMSRIENAEKVEYQVSRALPCVIYTGAQLTAVQESGGNPVDAAKEIIKSHPRCLDALGLLANDAIFRKDYVAAKPYIYALLDVAPARQSVVRLAAMYAVATNDKQLQLLLSSQGIKLGLIETK